MITINKKTADLIPYIRNPRKNDQAVDAISASIKEFGFLVPIVIDKEGVIVAGHTRTKAAQKLGLAEVPCLVADNLTPEQIKAFRILDNKLSEKAEWDFELLQLELAELPGFDFEKFEVDFSEVEIDDLEELDDNYSRKVEAPIYEPKNIKPQLGTVYNATKTNELISKIEGAKISKDEKDFLIAAARRHTVFNYQLIADYYAQATKEVQELMEQSALVIIDFNKAIESGFVKLTEEIAAQYNQDYPEDAE